MLRAHIVLISFECVWLIDFPDGWKRPSSSDRGQPMKEYCAEIWPLWRWRRRTSTVYGNATAENELKFYGICGTEWGIFNHFQIFVLLIYYDIICIYFTYTCISYTQIWFIDISTCSRNANVYNIYVSLLLMIACVALRDSHTPSACKLLYWDIPPASNWMDEHSKLGSLEGNEQKTLYRRITYWRWEVFIAMLCFSDGGLIKRNPFCFAWNDHLAGTFRTWHVFWHWIALTSRVVDPTKRDEQGQMLNSALCLIQKCCWDGALDVSRFPPSFCWILVSSMIFGYLYSSPIFFTTFSQSASDDWNGCFKSWLKAWITACGFLWSPRV